MHSICCTQDGIDWPHLAVLCQASRVHDLFTLNTAGNEGWQGDFLTLTADCAP